MSTDYMVVPSANNSLAAIQGYITFGHAFLEKAEKAFETGDSTTAERCLDSAGQLSTDVVRQVCLLTDAEADTTEPAFTPFEDRQYHVAVLLGLLPRRCLSFDISELQGSWTPTP
jgi:hypothetical protein